MITCPSCGQKLRIPPATAAGRCPACGSELTITALTTPEPQVVYPRPVVESPQPMAPSGWFARAFAVAAGIIAASWAASLLLVVLAGCGVAIVFIVAAAIGNAERQPVAPKLPVVAPVFDAEAAAKKCLADYGYTDGVFIESITATEVTGDIRTAATSTPFTLYRRGEMFIRLVVGGVQVFPPR